MRCPWGKVVDASRDSWHSQAGAHWNQLVTRASNAYSAGNTGGDKREHACVRACLSLPAASCTPTAASRRRVRCQRPPNVRAAPARQERNPKPCRMPLNSSIGLIDDPLHDHAHPPASRHKRVQHAAVAAASEQESRNGSFCSTTRPPSPMAWLFVRQPASRGRGSRGRTGWGGGHWGVCHHKQHMPEL